MLLNEEQKMVQDMLRSYSQEKLKPTAAARDKTAQFPAQELKELGELGALGMTVSPEWGGAGLDYISLVVALEEIAAGDGAISTIVSVQNSLPCGITQRYGTDAQKQKYLSKFATGEWLGCFCLTEPQAGSDAGALECKAVREGDEWVLNGTKQFITTGKHAQVALVFAVTDKAAGKKGISCFLVPTDTEGYIVSRIEEKMGQHCSDTATIVLENCHIPADHLLGAEGGGYKIALSNLESGRIGIAAQSVGMARAALDAAVEYANERKAFGVEIVQHQAVAFRLADMATQIEAARQLIFHAAALKDAGLPCFKCTYNFQIPQ
jgi:alkylation response protein AidB-like acyl-CoA dehydrogenase